MVICCTVALQCLTFDTLKIPLLLTLTYDMVISEGNLRHHRECRCKIQNQVVWTRSGRFNNIDSSWHRWDSSLPFWLLAWFYQPSPATSFTLETLLYTFEWKALYHWVPGVWWQNMAFMKEDMDKYTWCYTDKLAIIQDLWRTVDQRNEDDLDKFLWNYHTLQTWISSWNSINI